MSVAVRVRPSRALALRLRGRRALAGLRISVILKTTP